MNELRCPSESCNARCLPQRDNYGSHQVWQFPLATAIKSWDLSTRGNVKCKSLCDLPKTTWRGDPRITNSLTLSSWEASIIIHELNMVSGGSVEVRHVGKTQCEAVMMRSLRGLHLTLEPPEHGWLQLRSQGRWTSQSGRGQVPKVVLIFLLYWK